MNRENILVAVGGVLVFLVILKLSWGDPRAIILQLSTCIAGFLAGRALRRFTS